MVMPAMRGPELAARLAETRPGLAVLFMSGYADEEVVLVPPGRRAFLQKPFTAGGLGLKGPRRAGHGGLSSGRAPQRIDWGRRPDRLAADVRAHRDGDDGEDFQPGRLGLGGPAGVRRQASIERVEGLIRRGPSPPSRS